MFNPWTAGPRVCPGKKFSQLEFVAVHTRLFRNGRVKLKVEAGEKLADATKRAKSVVADSVLDVTLHRIHPEKVRLVWESAE
jgi:cytochrome P450